MSISKLIFIIIVYLGFVKIFVLFFKTIISFNRSWSDSIKPYKKNDEFIVNRIKTSDTKHTPV